jgi:VWFA-related protein
MKLFHMRHTFLLRACIGLVLSGQSLSGQVVVRPASDATVLVTVRNGRGGAVQGMTAADFIVSERGAPDQISTIENLSPVSTTSQQVSPDSGQLKSLRQQVLTNSKTEEIHVLLIIAPMGATGRHDAIRAAAQSIARPVAEKCQIAILDDSGTYNGYGHTVDQLKLILEGLTKNVGTPQYVGGSWMRKANQAIRELGLMPGPRAILLVTDYESKSPAATKQNPWLQRVSPSVFVDSALRAQAGIYTVQSSGPATVVPLGSADATQPEGFQSGEDVAHETMDETVQLGTLRSDLIYAADATGGKPARSLADAFDQIAADAAGTYLVSFHPNLDGDDGAWHPVSVSLRNRDLRLRAPKYYAAPAMNGAQLPAAMLKALQTSGRSSDMGIAARAWLFPDSRSGVDNGVFAADVDWINQAPAPAAGTRIQLFAELINESTNAVAGSWYEQREWPSATDQSSGIRWHKEAPLYPGSYLLRVFSFDTTSGKVGAGEFRFTAHSLNGEALRFAAIVLVDGCLSLEEQSKSRQNLLDPLLWDGCELSPTPAGVFKSNQNPTVLVRMYPPNEQMAKIILNQWKAYAVVDGQEGTGKTSILPIVSADVRGLAAFGKVSLSNLTLNPGPHQLTVFFDLPTSSRENRRIHLNAHFSIEP